MRASIALFAFTTFLATASADLLPRNKACDGQGDGYLICSNGQNTMCYNPSKGDICCSNGMVYPVGSQCANESEVGCKTSATPYTTLLLTSTQFHTVTLTVTSNETATVTVTTKDTNNNFVPVAPATPTQNGGYGVDTTSIITIYPIGGTTIYDSTIPVDISSGVVPPYVLTSIASENNATISQAHSTTIDTENQGTGTSSLPISTAQATSTGATSNGNPSTTVAGFTSDGAKILIMPLIWAVIISMTCLSTILAV